MKDSRLASIARAAFASAVLTCAISLGGQARAADQTTITVFAAASLHDAFTDIATRFATAHPGVTVRLNFDGSQILETQIANGAPADVFASADERWMDNALKAGLVGTPVDFARNSIVMVAQFDVHVRSLRDLTRDGLKLAICAEQVPCGRYTRIALQKMSADKAFWPKYEEQVMRNVATQEQNVEGVVQKVLLGEADAGFVYATDVVQKGVKLLNYPVPDEDQELATYPIAEVKASAQAALARSFVEYVISAQGQSVLASYGFRTHS
ncbi:MAG: molybdate ABC transporter substrate-binding protein [Candidatus Eremiobacteraeota bacterium]|nr:molybdate ABC transporter substrate-binding protein [Candidatus Eremiobacteraeota bacterium]